MSRSFEICGRLWKAAWLHNVDNIQQKDIKYIMYGSNIPEMLIPENSTKTSGSEEELFCFTA